MEALALQNRAVPVAFSVANRKTIPKEFIRIFPTARTVSIVFGSLAFQCFRVGAGLWTVDSGLSFRGLPRRFNAAKTTYYKKEKRRHTNKSRHHGGNV